MTTQQAFEREAVQRVKDIAPGQSLTPRQRDVLRLIGLGMTDVEIAEALCINVSSAKTHVAKLYSCLGLQGNTGNHRVLAALFALRAGVVPFAEDIAGAAASAKAKLMNLVEQIDQIKIND